MAARAREDLLLSRRGAMITLKGKDYLKHHDTSIYRGNVACSFDSAPDCGLILSGWGDVLHADRVLAEISYQDIPGLGASTVLVTRES